MSYTALYRKFRPSTFEDVKGQDHIVTTLKNQIRKRFSVQMNRKTKLLNMSNTPLKQQIRQLHRKLRQQFKNPNQLLKCKLPPPAPMQHLIVK